jgi:predicted Zn-dependent protease
MLNITRKSTSEYLFLPTLSKNFWKLYRFKPVGLYDLSITNSHSKMSITNEFEYVRFRTDRFSWNNKITSTFELNGFYKEKKVVIKEKVIYIATDDFGIKKLNYDIGTTIQNNQNNMKFENVYEYNVQNKTKSIDNFWYLMPKEINEILDDITKLIVSNEDKIIILE